MGTDTRTGRTRTVYWLKAFLRAAILGLVVWGIWRTVDQARGKFAASELSLANLHYGWLALAGLLYLAGTLPSTLFWHRTLQSMGQGPHFPTLLRAFYVGNLGKYVPGKALVPVMRTGMIMGPCVDAAVAATSVFVETLTFMAVGAMIAAINLAFSFHEHRQLLLLSIALAVCSGLPTLPPVFRRVLRLLQVHRVSGQMDAALRGLNWRLMAFGWLTICLGWLLCGLSLWATLLSMPGVDANPAHFPLVTACVCLAVVAGFLSLLPAGFGVREFVVMQLMAPPFGVAAAIVSAVLLRVVWLAAELILAGVLYVAVRSPAPHSGCSRGPENGVQRVVSAWQGRMRQQASGEMRD